MAETEAGLTGELVYNSDLFDVATIHPDGRTFSRFCFLASSANPQQSKFGTITPALSAAEQHQLLSGVEQHHC